MQSVKVSIDINFISNGKIIDEEQFFSLIQSHNIAKSPLYKEFEDLHKLHYGPIKDSKLFKMEISQQLRIKAIRHQAFKKLGDEDFVAQKHPEAVVLERLKKSIEDSVNFYEDSIEASEKNNDYLNQLKKSNYKEYSKLKDDEKFKVMSKEEYQKLKQQIKERKEAKAKLIKQGFPSLKNYVYL